MYVIPTELSLAKLITRKVWENEEQSMFARPELCPGSLKSLIQSIYSVTCLNRIPIGPNNLGEDHQSELLKREEPPFILGMLLRILVLRQGVDT